MLIETRRAGAPMTLSGVHEKAMHQLQRKKPVNLSSVISGAIDVAPHNAFDASRLQIRARKRPGIKQHLLDIFCENCSVPIPKMKQLVPPQPKPFKMERREKMIDLGNPLWHAVVVSVFGLECELQIATQYGGGNAIVHAEAAISAQPSQLGLPSRMSRNLTSSPCSTRGARNTVRTNSLSK